jgi:uncharacterized repeat protein (TIGR03917 family)
MPACPPPEAPRRPAQTPPAASARRTGPGSYELTVRPGADVADVADALGAVPLDAVFVGRRVGAEAVLEFRTVPPAAADPAFAGTPPPLEPASPVLAAA